MLLAPIIKETVHLLRASLPAEVNIVLDLQRETGAVMGDPTQLHQVLMNLCTNAGHAMRAQGGELTLALKRVDMDEAMAAHYAGLSPGPYLRLSVKDTGHGMDRQTLERIFEPNFTTKQGAEGTGLGLAVVHGIVRGHGGAVTVYSEPGRGSEFHVYLPLLEAFRQEPRAYDLVITDLSMPRMSGIRLARSLLDLRPDLPILLCSGFADADMAGQARPPRWA